jgi:hypothetical protein
MRIAGCVLGLFAPIAAFAAPVPDLASCPPAETPDGWERERDTPLPVPAALTGVLASDLLRLALATLPGGTACIETSWIETAEDITLTPDGRFLSFGWLGYESYGHIMVDRADEGQVIETGVAPVFSPSRRYFAAADQSESEFGSLSGLAIWEVGPTSTAEIGRINELPRMHAWRIDGWVGESCIDLSAAALDLPPEEAEKAARVRYRAGPGKDDWHIAQAVHGCSGP